MMNPEESIPKEYPDDQAGESMGYSIVLNCLPDGSHDVFMHPMIQAAEADGTGGIFGLDSLEDALKAIIALKRSQPDYEDAEEAWMRQAYGEASDGRS